MNDPYAGLNQDELRQRVRVDATGQRYLDLARSWSVQRSKRWNKVEYYVRLRMYDGKRYLLHRLIAKPLPGMLVDHKDGDTLNNVKSNLRTCTPTQNNANSVPKSGGFKGVTFDKDRNAYRAQIGISGKTKKLGRFTTAEDAAKVYDEAALKLWGEFALTNKKMGLLT